jgi:hypothetical protein
VPGSLALDIIDKVVWILFSSTGSFSVFLPWSSS